MKLFRCLKFSLVILFLLLINTAKAQTEVLTNAVIIEMTKAGIGEELIVRKINDSAGNYDVSAAALIELKKNGVDDAVTALMLDVYKKTDKQNRNLSAEISPLPIIKTNAAQNAADLLREARTIFIVKHSLYPSISDLESSLLKRAGWQKFNLTITRNRAEADLVIDINHEFMTHYAFRVLDEKTGRVIAASGVTSLGGALSGNIADKIIKRLNETLAK